MPQSVILESCFFPLMVGCKSLDLFRRFVEPDPVILRSVYMPQSVILESCFFPLMVGCKCLGLFRRVVEPDSVIFKALCAAIGNFRVLFSI